MSKARQTIKVGRNRLVRTSGRTIYLYRPATSGPRLGDLPVVVAGATRGERQS